jgi:flagellar FliL protein
MSETPKTPAPSKSGGMRNVLIIGLVGLLAGGGAAFYFLGGRGATPAEAAHVERGVVAFDPFVVNLADASVSRFLRVSLQLVLADEEQAAKLEESKIALLQARSTILELLTTQTSDTLVTPDGKSALRASIVERVTHAIQPLKVVDVLFSDFVVQF